MGWWHVGSWSPVTSMGNVSPRDSVVCVFLPLRRPNACGFLSPLGKVLKTSPYTYILYYVFVWIDCKYEVRNIRVYIYIYNHNVSLITILFSLDSGVSPVYRSVHTSWFQMATILCGFSLFQTSSWVWRANAFVSQILVTHITLYMFWR